MEGKQPPLWEIGPWELGSVRFSPIATHIVETFAKGPICSDDANASPLEALESLKDSICQKNGKGKPGCLLAESLSRVTVLLSPKSLILAVQLSLNRMLGLQQGHIAENRTQHSTQNLRHGLSGRHRLIGRADWLVLGDFSFVQLSAGPPMEDKDFHGISPRPI